MDYKSKYLKYKKKYIELKLKIGGGKIVVDLNKLKPLVYRLVNSGEIKEEILFNFYVKDGDVKFEMSKGLSDMDGPEGLIKAIPRRGEFFAHTHPKDYAIKEEMLYNPPSPADYNYLLESYFKRGTRVEVVFDLKGMWIVRLTNDFITFVLKNFPDVVKSLRNSVGEPAFYSTDKFDKFADTMRNVTNNLFLLLAQPKSVGAKFKTPQITNL